MKIKSQTIEDEPLVTTAQLANYFNLSTATVNRWRLREGCPSIRYNTRLFRYKLSEVQAWLAAQDKKRAAQKAEVVK
jgi:phage terminase Nu1 subunit (DNA packaging protein)